MPHNSVAFLILVGVGLGAFLYYMFNDDEHERDNHHEYGNDNGENHVRSPESSGPWNHGTGENKPRRRKPRSSEGGAKTSCTICLAETEVAKPSIVQLFPCEHKFHKACIAKWQEQGPSETHNTCPNCREDILAVLGGNVSN